jgi:lipoprotein-anchoring transpeptidase ErfK/SrfK
LSEQTLVAYEAGRPVYATLVSSGKEGYETPRGLFRIRHKYLSVTMNGDDPIDGYYEVEEVPWTMYYWKSYAVHGAYWHNDFGKTRSHGCTNVPPVDARWLYYWTKPRVPENWHAVRRQRGTWVYFTS